MPSQMKKIIRFVGILIVQTICMYLYLFIAFPIATAVVLTIAGMLFNPLSLKWVLGFSAIPFCLIMEIESFKITILITSIFLSFYAMVISHRVSNTYLRCFWTSLIIFFGVALSVLSLPDARHYIADWINVLWIFSAAITGSFLPITTINCMFNRTNTSRVADADKTTFFLTRNSMGMTEAP